MRYHINPTTGRVNICRADPQAVKGKGCPFGGAEAHYPTKQEARGAYEKTQEAVRKPLKRQKSKSSLELEIEAGTEKWGPRGAGPDVNGLSSEEAIKARREHAEELIADHRLNSSMAEEKLFENAHKAGIPLGFLKHVMSDLEFEEKRRERIKEFNESRAERAQARPLPVLGTELEIDAHWTNVPGEGNIKQIRNPRGKETASIQLRDGFYLLGARDEAGQFVYFQQNSFSSEHEALKYLARNKHLLKI